MGLFDGLLGGGGSAADDPYADILTPAQRNRMQVQGLLAMAGAFAQAGMPSRLPVPFGSALGSAAAALGTGQDAGMKTAIENALAAQKVRDLRAKAGILAKLNPIFQQALDAADNPVAAPSPAGPGVSPGPPGAGVRPGGTAPAAAPAAGAPLTMELPYAPGGGGGLLGSDIGAEGEYGAGQKNPGGLLGPAPPVQRAGAAVGPVETTGSSSGAPVEPDPGAGGDTPWGPTFAQAASLGGPTRGDPRGKIPVIQAAAMRYGVDPDVAVKVAGSEGLGTFYGDGGKSGTAFQLYTGGGLGNVFQKETGLDPLDPKNEDAAIDWAMRNVSKTGWEPYHGARLVGVGNRTGLGTAGGGGGAGGGGSEDAGWGPTFAQGGPDRVIPSGGEAMRATLAGAAPAATLAQYQPQGGGLAAPGTLPLAAPGTLPQLAAPGAAPALGAGGKIPGLNMTPQKLAIIDAMAEAAGLGNPFKGLLDTYYKSPGYLQESAGATARGRIAEEEPSQLRIQAAKARTDLLQQMAKDALTLDDKGNVVEIPGMRQMLGKTAAEIEEAKQRATSQFQTVEATVLGPNGERTAQKMTQYEFTYREQQRAKNAAMGLSPQPGDIVSAATPESIRSSELGVTAGWKALEGTHAAELAANRSDQQLGQIAEAMRGFTPGKTAEWRLTWGQYLKDAGFKIDGVSDGEIMQQAQRRLQLAAANVHEGSVSNFERSIYGETVTQLTNTPEGIVKAIGIQQRLNDYDRKVAQIHRDTIVNGVPNLVEAQSRIAKLGPPLSPGELSALQEIRAGQVPGKGQGTGAADLSPDAKPIGTFQGKPVYQMPDGSRKVLQ